MVFAHGYGCDQNMWRFVAAKFEADYQVILFDYVGAGGADLSAYTPERYSTLDGYVNDVLEICGALDLHDVIFVGHSVSAMIGALATIAEPERFAALVFIGPSPRYIDDDSYVGGFAADDIDELLESLESNCLGWSSAMAPVIMGNPDRPELGEELTASFCRTDPEVARRFARVTFLSDNRADLCTCADTDPHLAVHQRCDRAAYGRRVRELDDADEHVRGVGSNRTLSASQCAGRHGRGDRRVPARK
jgi:sigma-B regulation protein RsbQ